MFSRSEKTEEATDVMAAEASGQRSPMVLAVLAGLLAIAGAFLLVWYLNSGGDGEVAVDPESPEAATAIDGSEASKQVLVVTQTIPRGTSVRELIDAPTVYLSARAVPEQFVAASAITSVAELQDLDGLILASEALPGEQLLRGRFRDPNDFDSGTETFLEAATGFDVPAGHHAVVVDLTAAQALGGTVRPGELVTVVANFRLAPPEGTPREASVVVLNSVEVLSVDLTGGVAGQLSTEVDQLGIASQGTFRITVAVRPEELTDMTYAIQYGEIVLATALDGLENEDGPRAITTIRQILGDDGVWLGDIEDGNVVDLIELYPAEGEEEGRSIEVELPTDEETASNDGPNEADLIVQDDGADLSGGDELPGGDDGTDSEDAIPGDS